MTSSFRALGVLALIGLLQVVATAEGAPDFGRFADYYSPTIGERVILEDLADDQLDDYSLVEAALLIGGQRGEAVHRYMRLLQASTQRCLTKVSSSDSPGERLSTIFHHLREDFLYGDYCPDLYDVSRTLSAGDFNCLTATLLFRHLCHAAAINVMAIWEPSHVQCWLAITPTRGYIIETTADSPQQAISQLERSGGVQGRFISQKELLGKVFYNKGVSCLKSDDYAGALGGTWVSCLLDPSDSAAQSNLRACLNNWALWAADHSDLVLADRLLEEGLELDPAYEPFARNRAILFETAP